MFSKFKSALYNVVGSFDPTEGGTVGNLATTLKFAYTRPHFLQLSSDDEVLVTADHAIRPIICPRDISRLPWNSGYAETINAGKSKRNEDQAAVHVGLLTRCVSRTLTSASKEKTKLKKDKHSAPHQASHKVELQNVSGFASEKETNVTSDCEEAVNSSNFSQLILDNSIPETSVQGQSLEKRMESHQFVVSLPYYYFGVFDGHAGWGAAVSAANQLHHIIHEKLCDVIDFILPDSNSEDLTSDLCGPFWTSKKVLSPESVIIGALEQAFWMMDQIIGEDRLKHQLSGGCTACVALFILGKVFVSNAGDSRGTIGFTGVPIPMSFDFTPETETQRIRKLGAKHPELLGGEFTHLEYIRRPLKRDVGKRAPYREHFMKGWALKTITEDDLKYPLVCGEGKRSRVLATIGVTRGFGDHDLKAQFSAVPIKPFLSPEPEVRVFDVSEVTVSDKDVLILATDGLWDIISNEKAVSVVTSSLQQFPPEDAHRYKYRYTSAAHDLVLSARGRLQDHNWRTGEDKHATIDDISVFVIPLLPYKEEFNQWQKEAQIATTEALETGVEPSVFESSAPTEKASNLSRRTNLAPELVQSSSEDSASVATSRTSEDENSLTVLSDISMAPSKESCHLEVNSDISDKVINDLSLISKNSETGSDLSPCSFSNNSEIISSSTIVTLPSSSSVMENSTSSNCEGKTTNGSNSIQPIDDYFEDCDNGD